MRERVLQFILLHPGCNASHAAREFGLAPEEAADIVEDLLASGELELA